MHLVDFAICHTVNKPVWHIPDAVCTV